MVNNGAGEAVGNRDEKSRRVGQQVASLIVRRFFRFIL
jgi:hypothetical protein